MHCKLEAIGGTMGRAKVNAIPLNHWAARSNTGLLIELMLKGVVFPFLFLLTSCNNSVCHAAYKARLAWKLVNCELSLQASSLELCTCG